MRDLFYKNVNGNYVPVSFESILQKDFENKLILVKIGDDKTSQQELENFYETFMSLEVVKEMVEKSENTSVFIVPNIVDLRIYSSNDIKNKKIILNVENKNLAKIPEIANELGKFLNKNVTVIPSCISIEEYLEVKEILKKSKIRKQRLMGR